MMFLADKHSCGLGCTQYQITPPTTTTADILGSVWNRWLSTEYCKLHQMKATVKLSKQPHFIPYNKVSHRSYNWDRPPSSTLTISYMAFWLLSAGVRHCVETFILGCARMQRSGSLHCGAHAKILLPNPHGTVYPWNGFTSMQSVYTASEYKTHLEFPLKSAATQNRL